MTGPLGDLIREGDKYTLRFERIVPHPRDKVWRALTDNSELVHWFPASIIGFGEAGSRLEFRMAPEPGQLPADAGDGGQAYGGEVVAYEPPRLLEYTWDGELLRWELTETADGTRIVFTHVFDDEARGARDASGWHHSLDALESRLAGTPATRFSDERFDELFQAYAEHLGESAATRRDPD